MTSFLAILTTQILWPRPTAADKSSFSGTTNSGRDASKTNAMKTQFEQEEAEEAENSLKALRLSSSATSAFSC